MSTNIQLKEPGIDFVVTPRIGIAASGKRPGEVVHLLRDAFGATLQGDESNHTLFNNPQFTPFIGNTPYFVKSIVFNKYAKVSLPLMENSLKKDLTFNRISTIMY